MQIDISKFRVVEGVDHIYGIGLADNLVTIRSQQIRAICLAYLLTKHVGSRSRKNVAIIGGGISGLTVSAQLIKLGWKNITIYEKLPDLLSVQNGCDTRWIHPKIINWPQKNSNTTNAELPILNWNSSTASDVTYSIENEWWEIISSATEQVASGKPKRVLSVLLGVTFLQVNLSTTNPTKKEFSIEWIRDIRVANKKILGDKNTPSGTGDFSFLILATGFGIEQNTDDSYWRNERLGQLQLDGIQQRFLVSGVGDGGITDLLRLTIKNFRPDRELTVSKLEPLADFLISKSGGVRISVLDDIYAMRTSGAKETLQRLIEHFKENQRNDTYVILHAIGKRGFRFLFDNSPASSLNKLFLYAIYKNGAFQYVESAQKDQELIIAEKYNIPRKNIIRRHGVDRASIIKKLFRESDGSPIKFDIKDQSVELCETYIKKSILLKLNELINQHILRLQS